VKQGILYDIITEDKKEQDRKESKNDQKKKN
jgi:hypothetical protein